MYTPIPGMSHLQLYVAPQRIRYDREPTAADVATRSDIHGLVLIALEVAATLRPMHHLDKNRFAPEIVTHIKAWLKGQPTSGKRGRFSLTSLHARANGEYFGSAFIGGQQRAFTGAATGRYLRSFRLLTVGPRLPASSGRPTSKL